MTTELSAAGFRKYLNQPFRISLFTEGSDFVDADLIEVRDLLGDSNREDHAPFSLLFKGPTDVFLEQQTFKVEQEEMGEMAIFIVTLGPDPEDAEKRMLYEAVFT